MTTKAELLKVIRQQCSECFGAKPNSWPVPNPSDIERCSSPACSLYPYRLGKDPSPSKGRKGNASNFRKFRGTERSKKEESC